MIPEAVRKFLSKSKEEQNCFCIAVNRKLEIIQYFGKASLLGIKPPSYQLPIQEYIPALLTESFESDFKIPFYNVTEEHVCTIYFLKLPSTSYIVMVDKSEIFRITKKYQQFAHDDNISKNKFKRLAEELSKAQKKLKQSNQDKATLIAMLSHELGTPLTSILGYSELLQNNQKNLKKGLEIINRNAEYLKNMIENTLLFGQSEAGEKQIQLEPISVQHFFSVLKATMLPAAQKKQLGLNMFYKGNQVINIDITRTQQILINLLNNAIKYTDEGSVELKFAIRDNKYIFSVIDTGLGVPEKMQKTIFNPWERVEESKEKGVGIGLFISKNLAQAINGQLLLKYSSPECGSIFQLQVPVNKIEQSEEENNYHDMQTQCQNKTLLVIDDDYDILELIEALLENSGLNIITTTDLCKAKEILVSHNIDIVLTDFNLGSQQASLFVKDIKNIKAELPILLMSAMPSIDLQQNYQQMGFCDVISKPLNSKKLINSITEFLQ